LTDLRINRHADLLPRGFTAMRVYRQSLRSGCTNLRYL